MSETQVIEQTNVTTTVQLKETEVEEETFVEEKSEKLVGIDPERTTSKNETTTGLTHNEEVLTNDEQDHRYDDDDFVEGGNSEAVSISSSKLRASTVQFSNNNTNVISSSTREDLLDKFGECAECKRPNTGDDNWCQSCNSEHFRSQFDKWRSENENIDKIIRNAQLSAKNSKYVLEWIPYNKFKNVDYVAKGGYGTIYSAKWSDGHILGWDKNLNRWKRYGTDLVALKRIHNSQFVTMEFLDQIVKTHLQLHDSNMIIQYYGMTRYPETDDYMIVMEYAIQGSIYNVAHDDHLAAEICFGKRPEIPMHTPKLLEDLIKRCWDMNPSSRPSAKELKDLITQWWNDIQNDKETEIHAQCKASDEVSRNSTFTPTPLLYVSHPEAVYHSRLLEFNNLPKPNKANRRSKLPSSLPYSESRQIDSVASEYQDEDPSDETVSCICPFNNIVNWINSFYKKHKIKK
ncbi:unnamed protein product [Rhizophagus irregularis]|nr:unnamed protein product [Rhizophagus irregularis]CAB5372253.1 unnamed protein product [Rhizophagus irregularis]